MEFIDYIKKLSINNLPDYTKKLEEYNKLKIQGFPNVHLCYNNLSNYYMVMLFSKSFIESRFKQFDVVV